MKIEDFVVGKKYKKIGGVAHLGEIATMRLVHGSVHLIFADGSSTYCNFSGQKWEPVEEFKCGDQICIDANRPYTYVATTPKGNIITMGRQGMKLTSGVIHIWNTSGWKHYEEPKKVEPKVELTMEEIADKLGIEVSNLKIVGEK